MVGEVINDQEARLCARRHITIRWREPSCCVFVGDAREPPRQSQESLPTGGGWARAHHQTTEDVRREVLPVLRIIVCEAWVVAP